MGTNYGGINAGCEGYMLVGQMAYTTSEDEDVKWSKSSSYGPDIRPLLSSSSIAFTLETAVMDQPDGPDSPLDSTEEKSIKLAPIKTGRIGTVLFACVVAVLGSFSVGFVIGFSSPALPDLDKKSGTHTDMNKSIYHSMFNVSTFFIRATHQ